MTIREIFPGASEVTVFYIDEHDQPQDVPLARAGKVRFEDCKMIRRIASHVGQTNFIGWHWSSTTQTHIEFESHLESQWMTLFDFDPQIIGMAAQPFRIVGIYDGSLIDHTPDFFCRRVDGVGVVVDVRSTGLMDDRMRLQAAATQAWCETVGFEYELVNEPDPQWWINVRFLAHYRRTPAFGMDHVGTLLDLAQDPVPFAVLAASADIPELMGPVVLHLCWTQQLTFDLGAPLQDRTMLCTREA